MVSMDHAKKSVKLLLKASDILPILQEEENQNPGYAKILTHVHKIILTSNLLIKTNFIFSALNCFLMTKVLLQKSDDLTCANFYIF